MADSAVFSPGTRSRSTSAVDPQCSTLLEDGTRCTSKGTNGNPDKLERRCKTHNSQYQFGYRAYKDAGDEVKRLKAERSGRIPTVKDIKRMKDLSSLNELEGWLNSLRAAVDDELTLRENHTAQFMLTLDEGHMTRHANCRQDRDRVDNALGWLHQQRFELLNPPPPKRARAASQVVPRTTPISPPGARLGRRSSNAARGHMRRESEPVVLSSSVRANTPYSVATSKPVVWPNRRENIRPGSQSLGVEAGRASYAAMAKGSSESQHLLAHSNIPPGYGTPSFSHPSSAPKRPTQFSNQQPRAVYDYGSGYYPQAERPLAYNEGLEPWRANNRTSYANVYDQRSVHFGGHQPDGNSEDGDGTWLFGIKTSTVLKTLAVAGVVWYFMRGK